MKMTCVNLLMLFHGHLNSFITLLLFIQYVPALHTDSCRFAEEINVYFASILTNLTSDKKK